MIVLIIDDDVDERLLLSEAFCELDPSIILQTASRCEHGQLLLTCDPLPDLVLLDDTMPMQSGMDCLRQIRADERLQNVRIVMYSTFHQENVKELRDLNADFLVKHSDYMELKEALRKLIN